MNDQLWMMLLFLKSFKNEVWSIYSLVLNKSTALNNRTGGPIFWLPLFLSDTLLNKNHNSVSNKLVQVKLYWQN